MIIASPYLCGRRCSIPVLLANPRQCPCRRFSFDPYGDHIQTCQRTPAAGHERGDNEIKDYVILPRGEDDRLPPRALMMDVTIIHDHYGSTNGTLTHRVSSQELLSLTVL
jgi:hypothetical protein